MEISKTLATLSHAGLDRSSDVGMSLRAISCLVTRPSRGVDTRSLIYFRARARAFRTARRRFRRHAHLFPNEGARTRERWAKRDGCGRTLSARTQWKQLVNSTACPITKLATIKVPGRALNSIQPIREQPYVRNTRSFCSSREFPRQTIRSLLRWTGPAETRASSSRE